MINRKILASVGRSAGMKILVLPASALLGIVNVRLILEEFGLGAYAQYGLIVAIGALLPFADLGISAVLMNAVGASNDPRNDPNVQRILVSCFRLLIVSCTVLLAATAVITAVGAWPSLLGDALVPGTGAATAAMCLALIAITLVVSPGQRVLAGLGRNHVPIGVLGLQSPLVLLTILVITRTEAPLGPYIAVIPYAALLILQIVLLGLAARAVRPMVGRAIREVPKLRTVRGGAVFDVAWPMLVWMVFNVIAMQTDRLVLSHVSTEAALAEYNLSAQIFLPVLHVVGAAGFALWPIFAKQRQDAARASPAPLSLLFGAAALAACVVLGLVTPLLTQLASGGRVHVSPLMIVVFSFLMVFQSLKYPLNVYLTDPPGLRFQVYVLLATLPLNLALSYALAMRLGAPGPIIGSALAIVLQYAACLVYARRQLRAGVPAHSIEAEQG